VTGQGDDWLNGYVRRVSTLLRESALTTREIADQWGERSLDGVDWTADSMTADAIEAWERVTPLAGRGIDLWLELVQRSVPPSQSPAGAQAPEQQDPPASSTGWGRYLAMWQSVNAKMSAGSYRSADLVDDWFSGLGMVARDATATLTSLARAGRTATPREGDGAG
jgi:hypothetical protein